MEIPQGSSLCSYLYLKLNVMFFCFIFSLFSPTKSENRKAEQILPRGRAGTSGRVEVLGKGGRRVNTMQ
jgi:hypothetical protein